MGKQDFANEEWTMLTIYRAGVPYIVVVVVAVVLVLVFLVIVV